MAVDGSVEHAVVTHPSRNALMSWTQDGRYILFASDRAGQTALWAQTIAGGKAVGEPALMKTRHRIIASFGTNEFRLALCLQGLARQLRAGDGA